MNICFCVAKDAPSAAIRQRLEALEFKLLDLASVAAGEHGCNLCLLVLPSELDDAVVSIGVHRKSLPGPMALVVCGPWPDFESISRLLAAGADDYLPLDVEMRLLGLRLQISDRQAAKGTTAEQPACLDNRLVQTQRLETLASLTGSLAHDYNNLLSAIQGNAELALMDLSLDVTVRHCLSQINSAAHRAADLTRQIQAFRGSGAASNSDQCLNLSQLIRDMGELLRVSVFRNCRIEYHLAESLPLVAGDPICLRQLIMTLTMLASRSLGSGGGLIQLRTRRGDGDGPSQVVFEVQHSYAGIRSGPADQFARSESTDSGLAAAQIIAGRHDAAIGWIANGSGGTHRTVFAAKGNPTAERSASEIPGMHGRSAGTILLIDDEEAVRVAAHRFLRRAGYTVFDASSSEEGLALVAQLAAVLDAVLVDLNMPGTECRDLLKLIRERRPEIQLVVWSGFPEEAARERLSGFPDVAFIEKPAQLADLAGALERVIKR